MSILNSIFQSTIGRILPSSSRPRSVKNDCKKRDMDKEVLGPASSHKRRKREDSEDFEERFEIITKRMRVDGDRYAPIVNGEIFESAEMEGSFAGPMNASTQQERDRALMPPPYPSPLNSKANDPIKDEEMTESTIDIDNISYLSQWQKPANEFSSDYDMEKARRHAAATTLPPNSGVWESRERDLFYHLSYRGFEPLLPENWMQDFETLPLSLYATAATNEPLIHNYQTKEFRAIRELRDLLSLGKNVRDKVLATPGVHRERIIERATDKYISWALTDVGIKLPSSTKSQKTSFRKTTILPIHVVVKLKNRQTTQDALLELKHKLHTLACQHREARNIYTSIEEEYNGHHTPAVTIDETQVLESSEDDLPVLYGVLICRSILAVFTMNSQTPLPKDWRSVDNHQNQIHRPSPDESESHFGAGNLEPSNTTISRNHKAILDRSLPEETTATDHLDMLPYYEEDNTENDAASDPRFISDFDFSDLTRDVWNALVIAILAMQIRKDMLALRRNYDRRSDPLDEVTTGIEEASVTDAVLSDDDPDL